MVDKYFSSVDLPYLEQRISQVFLEKPMIVRFSINPGDWVEDAETDMMKTTVTIDTTGFTGDLMGEVSLYLDAISDISRRMDVYDTVREAGVQLLSSVNENETLTLIFYAGFEVDVAIPMVLTITGEMPTPVS